MEILRPSFLENCAVDELATLANVEAIEQPVEAAVETETYVEVQEEQNAQPIYDINKILARAKAHGVSDLALSKTVERINHDREQLYESRESEAMQHVDALLTDVASRIDIMVHTKVPQYLFTADADPVGELAVKKVSEIVGAGQFTDWVKRDPLEVELMDGSKAIRHSVFREAQIAPGVIIREFDSTDVSTNSDGQSISNNLLEVYADVGSLIPTTNS